MESIHQTILPPLNELAEITDQRWCEIRDGGFNMAMASVEAAEDAHDGIIRASFDAESENRSIILTKAHTAYRRHEATGEYLVRVFTAELAHLSGIREYFASIPENILRADTAYIVVRSLEMKQRFLLMALDSALAEHQGEPLEYSRERAFHQRG